MRFVPGCNCCGGTASFSGTLKNCAGVFASQTIVVKDHGSGSTLATVTTDGSGAFSGSVPISGTSLSVDFTTSGITRFADLSSNKTLVPGSNAVGVLSLAAASGFACSAVCAYPLKTTINLHDSFLGTDRTMTWNGTAWDFNTGTYLLNTSLRLTFNTISGSGSNLSNDALTCPVTGTFSEHFTLGPGHSAYPSGSTMLLSEI